MILFISLWAALSLIIGAITYFEKGDCKFQQYDLGTSACIAGLVFISPILFIATPFTRLYLNTNWKNNE